MEGGREGAEGRERRREEERDIAVILQPKIGTLFWLLQFQFKSQPFNIIYHLHLP